jgi:hypothetical protein
MSTTYCTSLLYCLLDASHVLCVAAIKTVTHCILHCVQYVPCDTGMQFVGFLVMGNQMKPQTKAVLEEVAQAGNSGFLQLLEYTVASFSHCWLVALCMSAHCALP